MPKEKATMTFDKLATDIKTGRFRNIVFMVGAGISTSAGIPDFRSPSTGLYANLSSFNLPYPEAIFELAYFRKHPDPFYQLALEINPEKYNEPTIFHKFIADLAQRGWVKRVYTQNIDTLERLAGIPSELVVEAHGSFAGNRCLDCRHPMTQNRFTELLYTLKTDKDSNGRVNCDVCKKGLVKPDIVFFGEGLPNRFFECMEEDFDDEESDTAPDLVIVAGTSLTVHPFAGLPEMVGRKTVRVLINRDEVGSFKRVNDLVLLTSCDNFVIDCDWTFRDHSKSEKEEGEPSQKSSKSNNEAEFQKSDDKYEKQKENRGKTNKAETTKIGENDKEDAEDGEADIDELTFKVKDVSL
jgi:NAD-dependent histone deacetylase SIR2